MCIHVSVETSTKRVSGVLNPDRTVYLLFYCTVRNNVSDILALLLPSPVAASEISDFGPTNYN